MRMSRFAASSLVLVTACGSFIAQAEEAVERPHYYTLSISLAPALCKLHPENRELRICQEGYSIIVQGFGQSGAMAAACKIAAGIIRIYRRCRSGFWKS